MRIAFTLVSLLFLTRLSLASIISDSVLIKKHLIKLTETPSFRNHNNIEQLNKTADYIQSVFLLYSRKVFAQEFNVNNRNYKNIMVSFGTENTQRIIIGAHYDVCGEQKGADDNATGVTGLLELARMLKDQKLKYRIDLVAYSLEEPPYFRTENMGSYVHAKSLSDSKVPVYGMISLEMIGYFSDDKNSQTYPVESMSSVYGTTGDFITLVRKTEAGKFADEFCKVFKTTNAIKTETFAGPPSLPGIDFSDHLNYWTFGCSAIMISDTAFYRNKNYHSYTDTIETLDLTRMGKVIDGVFQAILSL